MSCCQNYGYGDVYGYGKGYGTYTDGFLQNASMVPYGSASYCYYNSAPWNWYPYLYQRGNCHASLGPNYYSTFAYNPICPGC